MRVGVPKEIKESEQRVSLTPSGVKQLVRLGHAVHVQSQAGLGSGYLDESYIGAGATLFESAKTLYAESDLIIKVKEPLGEELAYLRRDQILFTYLHLAASKTLTEALLASRVTSVAYETIEKDGGLPLLQPMSQVAGRMVVLQALKYLTSDEGGAGVLLGGVPGVMPQGVTIVGAGTVGTEAAKMAAGLGGNVFLMDVNPNRIAYLEEVLPKNVKVLYASPDNLEIALKQTRVLIGAVLVPGGKAPNVVSEQQVRTLPNNSVILDVAVDQGGCIAGVKPTSISNPVYRFHGHQYYGVPNIPGLVPMTSTQALTQNTFPYLVKLVTKGKEALSTEIFKGGLNTMNGELYNEAVGKAHSLPYIITQ